MNKTTRDNLIATWRDILQPAQPLEPTLPPADHPSPPPSPPQHWTWERGSHKPTKKRRSHTRKPRPPNHRPNTPPEPHLPPSRPYKNHPSQDDDEGEPWCDCCTAQLSDDDPSQPGMVDPATPSIRYRRRTDNDQPPSHSNQHLDYMRLFRDNAEYNNKQRHLWEDIQARGEGSANPEFRNSSTYYNTPSIADLENTIDNLQYERYRRRGGRFLRADHAVDFRFNSPNVRNMAPGQPYRTWFRSTISNRHYSLGEATTYYNDWINDPIHGPDRDRDHRNIPYLPQGRNMTTINRDPTAPHSRPLPPPSSTDTPSDSDSHYSSDAAPLPPNGQPPENRAQTFVEDIHTSPDDPNAVVDSGAMMTTSPRRLLLGTPWEQNIRPAPPGTSIRYGNMETEPVEEMAHIGSYQTSIVPDRFSTALVCVHDIVAAGHNVTFTNFDTIVTDIGSAYTLRIPRNPASREWRVPLHILQRLTDLRTAHPIRHAQPYQPNSSSS